MDNEYEREARLVESKRSFSEGRGLPLCERRFGGVKVWRPLPRTDFGSEVVPRKRPIQSGDGSADAHVVAKQRREGRVERSVDGSKCLKGRSKTDAWRTALEAAAALRCAGVVQDRHSADDDEDDDVCSTEWKQSQSATNGFRASALSELCLHEPVLI